MAFLPGSLPGVPDDDVALLPGSLQGVRLSGQFSDGRILKPQIVDEVIQIVRDANLKIICINAKIIGSVTFL